MKSSCWHFGHDFHYTFNIKFLTQKILSNKIKSNPSLVIEISNLEPSLAQVEQHNAVLN